MANIELLDLSQSLQMKAPDAALPYLVRELRAALIEFCEKSKAYIHRLEPMVVIKNKYEYDLCVPQQTKVAAPLYFSYDSTPLTPTSDTLLNQDMPDWQTKAGTPTRFFVEKDKLFLARVPAATVAQAVTGKVALKPTRTAAVVDEDFYEENEQAVLDGALARIFGTVGKPWSDPGLAQLHRSLFLDAIEDAKAKSQQDHTPKPRVTAYGGI